MNPLAADDPSAPSVRRELPPARGCARETRSTGRIYVILPAYNEEENLERLLHRIRQALEPLDHSYEVVIVNDGSQDQTAEIARRMSESMPIQLENHRQNQGLGGTLRTGFVAALKHADANDILISMDADNTQPPESIPRMVEMIDDGFDLVVASRFRPGAQVIGLSPFRRLLSTGARCVFTALHPIPGIRDYTCGFRAYRAGVVQRAFEQYGDAFFSEKGFASMADILLKLRRQPLRAGEIPLVLRYDQKIGESKMKVARTIWATLKLAARRRFQ